MYTKEIKMAQEKRLDHNISKRFAAGGGIFLSFIVAFEIVIMISPFAFFFYAAFNPFLLALNQSSITRWLTAFFLPHMVVPPNEVLIVIRILGSLFFVAGMLIFFVCAVQVYMGKLLKRGVATKGFYAFIRHPQYLGLGLAALGLAVMWPRFLTLTLFAVMLFLYYLLAKDEERKMTNRFGESYISYMNRTGMFFPHFIEKVLIGSSKPQQRLSFGKGIFIFAVLLVIVIGSGFILRAYTVHHLPLKQVNGVDVIAITKEDLKAAEQLLPSVLQAPAIASKFQPSENSKGHCLLVYFIPIDYVMQGMIADTGGEWKLFEQHKTIGMITEYILHPFGHLTGGHAGHVAMGAHNLSMHDSPAMKRRIIFIEVSGNNHEITSPFDDFDINMVRTPLFFVDVHLHTGEILQVKNTPAGSGWGTVPTPMF
jgi:protein-S-isoprenylcysteine O-methyltransferase Ste14